MEKLSRVRKYENLRNEIDTAPSTNLNRVDPSIFKKIEINEEAPKREKEVVLKKNEDTFENEYMDDLIRDVKQYNREKGLLQSDITEIDILNQLKNPTRLKEDYVKTIEEKPKLDEATLVQSKQEIAMQIQELLKEDSQEGMNVSKIEPQITKETIAPVEEDDNVEETMKDETIQRLNEQTLQMKIQIDKQEEDLEDLSQNIDKTNRLLNIILLILVIALFAVIGFTIFTIMKNGGKI